MGSLAARYLQQAGFDLRAANRSQQKRQLIWPNAQSTQLHVAADDNQPIEQLLIATKGPQTAAAIKPLLPRLAPQGTIICLQNGMGTLADISLPNSWQVIDAVTTNAAWREDSHITMVAENHTAMGHPALEQPAWFAALAKHWPQLRWQNDIHFQQWQKLTVNAVINPLTALYNCPNGELLTLPHAQQSMEKLAQECDAVAHHYFPQWSNDTLARAQHIAHATAKNCSSMRADFLAKRVTEIEYINGYLIKAAEQANIPVPQHRYIYQQICSASMQFNL